MNNIRYNTNNWNTPYNQRRYQRYGDHTAFKRGNNDLCLCRCGEETDREQGSRSSRRRARTREEGRESPEREWERETELSELDWELLDF
ncbi:hypothetical protein ACOMHN_005850 [Nucella lapillus]